MNDRETISDDLGLEHWTCRRCDEAGEHDDRCECCYVPDCDSIEREPDCSPGESHDWTSAGMGGCDENPGVWSVGGTAYQFAERCTVCATVRKYLKHGSQRNPYECDSVSYSAE